MILNDALVIILSCDHDEKRKKTIRILFFFVYLRSVFILHILFHLSNRQVSQKKKKRLNSGTSRIVGNFIRTTQATLLFYGYNTVSPSIEIDFSDKNIWEIHDTLLIALPFRFPSSQVSFDCIFGLFKTVKTFFWKTRDLKEAIFSLRKYKWSSN